jgi:hypothetical protein
MANDRLRRAAVNTRRCRPTVRSRPLQERAEFKLSLPLRFDELPAPLRQPEDSVPDRVLLARRTPKFIEPMQRGAHPVAVAVAAYVAH